MQNRQRPLFRSRIVDLSCLLMLDFCPLLAQIHLAKISRSAGHLSYAQEPLFLLLLLLSQGLLLVFLVLSSLEVCSPLQSLALASRQRIDRPQNPILPVRKVLIV